MVSPMHERVKMLDQAFEYANEYVLETTDCWRLKSCRLCYARGPEGIIIELAEKIG